MGDFPPRINDRPLPDLHEAIAWSKSSVPGGLNEIHMSPIVPVVMNIVADLAEQNALRFEDPKRLFNEWWVGIGKAVLVLLGRPHNKPKPGIEIL
jgi:hypothetical protein